MSFLAPVLVLGLVIFVHELGHFLAAKAFGVYAPRFSLGFGKALWARRWGETEFVIAAVPLGGYVRMATRDDEATVAMEGSLDEAKSAPAATLDPNVMIPFGSKPVPPERWFESKPLWQRAIILLAGVTMNAILAVVVCAGIVGVKGIPRSRPVVSVVVDTMPAGRAGILAGDSIATVNDVATPTWADVVTAISASPGREVTIGVVRDGSSRSFTVVPEAAIDTNPLNGETRQVGRVGVGPSIARDRVSPMTAVTLGARQSWFMASRVVEVLGGLVTGRIGVNQLGGPVAIVRASVETARTGLENLALLIAFLSINLAILNLVPIPLLDGGQLLLQTAESIKGKPFSDRAREWYARIGLAAIAALFLVVTFNDLKALVISWIS